MESEVLPFTNFYRGIRGHFSSNQQEFNRFREQDGIKNKIRSAEKHKTVSIFTFIFRFLLKHEQITSKVRKLLSEMTENEAKKPQKSALMPIPAAIPLRSKKKKPSRFPFLSQKADVIFDKQCGRKLVAKEKIDAGKSS